MPNDHSLRQTGAAPRRVLIVLAEAERGDAVFRAANLATMLGQAGMAVTVTSCFGRLPLSDRVMRALARSGCGLDLTPHLLDYEETVAHLASQVTFFDVVVAFQDVADLYPAFDRLHWTPPLVEVGETAAEAVAGPKHHTTLYVALNAETATAAASRADGADFTAWVLPLPVQPQAGMLLDLLRAVSSPVERRVASKWVAALEFAMKAVVPAPAPSVFRSFWQGGFECSTQRRRDGHRVDVLATTGHDQHARADFAQLGQHRMRTCRSGVRWHLVEPAPGHFDATSFLAQAQAAREVGTQVVWDLMHYGYPDDIDIWAPDFPERFARFARRTAQVLRDVTDDVPFWCPVNEISFQSWGAGDVGYLNPFGRGRGLELKVQLARAAIAASHALREVDPRARLVACEPLISVREDARDPTANHKAQKISDGQFQACDFLTGRAWPQLGGAPELLDILGLNYYPPNQWTIGSGPIRPGHALYRPLSDLLTQAYARYGKPVFISETGAEGEARAGWFTDVAQEVMRARARGVPVEGLCLYPIANHVGWDDERICPNGLFGHQALPGGRTVYQPLAQALRVAQFVLDHDVMAQRAEAA